jgi:hypothetical protein
MSRTLVDTPEKTIPTVGATTPMPRNWCGQRPNRRRAAFVEGAGDPGWTVGSSHYNLPVRGVRRGRASGSAGRLGE